MPSSTDSARERLVELLMNQPQDPVISELLDQVEAKSTVDLFKAGEALAGVWELRWSSATQPWLTQAQWLENLQVIDLKRGRGMNLLRLGGPMADLAAVAVQADLTIESKTRVSVRFRRGGWLGPSLISGWRPTLMAAIQQSFPAWLEITWLDERLRVCRGNAGTRFALLRRDDLSVDALMGERP
ncbi:MAG: PAP fibrillin [Synechococcaceae bacterium WB9_4xB_025]|nr:PAP fibrillin [Synechococcaceae bacterium WB9_4xB_025]